MYQNVKLEKGMYHITGKSFSQVLESQDPSSQYADTPMAGMDAFERQLKRFDIHVSGPNCDRVEKFFSTTESAVLFPEFVRRAVYSGIENSVLSEIVAVQTKTESNTYLPGVFTDSAAYGTRVNQGTEFPVSTYYEASTGVTMAKYGRTIKASYEAIRRQRLDEFGKLLRSVGVRLANTILERGVYAMEGGAAGSVELAGAELTYSDLVNLYGKFTDFDMTTLMVSPTVAAKIMQMEQMKEMASSQPNTIVLPFGAKMRKCASMSSDYVVGLDHNFALEMITASDLVLETDKLIDSQLDVITISLRSAFRVLVPTAVYTLNLA